MNAIHDIAMRLAATGRAYSRRTGVDMDLPSQLCNRGGAGPERRCQLTRPAVKVYDLSPGVRVRRDKFHLFA